MFLGASNFNQPLNEWDVSNVTEMESMFFFAGSFNQDFSSWNISDETDNRRMFVGTPIKIIVSIKRYDLQIRY